MNRIVAIVLALNIAFANLIVSFHLPLSTGTTQSFEDMNEAVSVFHAIYADSSRSVSDRLVALHALCDIGVNHYDEITAANLNKIESDASIFFNPIGINYNTLLCTFMYDSGIIIPTSSNYLVQYGIELSSVIRTALGVSTYRESVLALYNVTELSGITRSEHTTAFIRDTATNLKTYKIYTTLSLYDSLDTYLQGFNNGSLYHSVIDYINNYPDKDQYLFGVFDSEYGYNGAESFNTYISPMIGNVSYDSSKVYKSVNIVAIKISDYLFHSYSAYNNGVIFAISNDWVDYCFKTPLYNNYDSLPFSSVMSFAYTHQYVNGNVYRGYLGSYTFPVSNYNYWGQGSRVLALFVTQEYPNGGNFYNFGSPFLFTANGRSICIFNTRQDAIDYDLGRDKFYMTSYVPESKLNNIQELIENTNNYYTYIQNNYSGDNPTDLQEVIDSIVNVGQEQEEANQELKGIRKLLDDWYNDWVKRSPSGTGPDENDADWKDFILPLLYIVFILFCLIEIISLLLSLLDYLFHIVMISASTVGLNENFVAAVNWLKGITPEGVDPFYVINVGNVHITCFDFMVLIFEMAFIGCTISLIRKYIEKVDIPDPR